nr:UDP-N-acetylmuramoyl-L-alanine--D-glutamate ligase [Candidatus Cloacimonadota bacterium]
LQTGGYNSILAGNIGKAFTSYPIEKTGIDFIVLELSSFQLDSIDTFAPEVAVLLNITPDHLNRYECFDDYANSKFRIFENQVKKEFAVLNKDDPQIKSRIAKIGSQKKYFSLRSKAEMYFDGENLTSSDITISKNLSLLKGPHNISNIMAALLSVSHLDIPNDLIVKAIRSFSSLEHRLEFVAEIENVVFINDSKATNTDAVKYALQSFSKPIRIILGGSNKGEDFSILLPFLKIYSKKLYLIGETQNKMRSFFNNEIELSCYNDFSDCIKSAFREAAKGEIVLLSPACASFDMFRNFEDRGRKFKKIVMEIKDEH